jgi:electron transport complex protein RnfB
MISDQDHYSLIEKNSERLYKKLARHLDNLPAGFPETGNGLELHLLRRLFTPVEAELAAHVTLIPEEADVIALRAGLPPDQTAVQLKEMALKGLIFSIERPNKSPLYMANQFVIGIWEYHVQDLDLELIKDMNSYLPPLFKEAWRIPQLRTIPVNRSLTPKLEVFTYENAEELIKRQKKIVVAPCICRRERTMAGEGCSKPLESCLVFGLAADYYERNGLGRVISVPQAMEILHQADEMGLVLQPGNYQKAGNICCCCGCCCGVLRTLKQLPRPVDHISSPFYAVSDPTTCTACGTCVDRCQMDAVAIENGIATINLDRCIGCGLCVTTCSTESMTLIRKPADRQPVVYETSRQTYLQLGRLRKKLSRWEILKMLFRSKVDRLFVVMGINNHYVKLKSAWK